MTMLKVAHPAPKKIKSYLEESDKLIDD